MTSVNERTYKNPNWIISSEARIVILTAQLVAVLVVLLLFAVYQSQGLEFVKGAITKIGKEGSIALGVAIVVVVFASIFWHALRHHEEQEGDEQMMAHQHEQPTLASLPTDETSLEAQRKKDTAAAAEATEKAEAKDHAHGEL